jgi:hypothetical protein
VLDLQTVAVSGSRYLIARSRIGSTVRARSTSLVSPRRFEQSDRTAVLSADTLAGGIFGVAQPARPAADASCGLYLRAMTMQASRNAAALLVSRTRSKAFGRAVPEGHAVTVASPLAWC